jgi:type VI secretion system protein ImpE
MVDTDAGQLFRDGKLGAAIEAAGVEVRQSPTSAGPRILLAELLLFARNLERADSVLDAAGAADSALALVLAEFRQLLRAATARRQVILEGRLPEFLGEPTESQSSLLQALVCLRAGDAAGAAAAAQAAETARPPVAGASDGSPFIDFRDADDLWSGTFEVLTTTGKYFWIPTERVVSLEFHPPKRPRDLVWRRCSMVVRDGPDGDVYVPALYDSDASTRDELLLGRETEWTQTDPVRGIGQRIFVFGEDGVAVQQLTTLEFA